MSIHDEIARQHQSIARCEKSLAQEKIKKRKADTRRKIEFGGLVIKSTLDAHNKSIILGALIYTARLIEEDPNYLMLFESIGDGLFLSNVKECSEKEETTIFASNKI